MSELVTMAHADSSLSNKTHPKKKGKGTESYESDADMTDEEILEGLMEITALSLSDTLEDEPTYE